jgi:hypothetical protein
VSLEARRTPVPAADFYDSGEYDNVDSGKHCCADDYANRDGQRVDDEPDATSRWSRSNSLMFYLRVVLT